MNCGIDVIGSTQFMLGKKENQEVDMREASFLKFNTVNVSY
jgi:hypothetical protein